MLFNTGKFILSTIAFLIVIFIYYAATAFLKWNLHPEEWGWFLRLVFVAFIIFVFDRWLTYNSDWMDNGNTDDDVDDDEIDPAEYDITRDNLISLVKYSRSESSVSSADCVDTWLKNNNDNE